MSYATKAAFLRAIQVAQASRAAIEDVVVQLRASALGSWDADKGSYEGQYGVIVSTATQIATDARWPVFDIMEDAAVALLNAVGAGAVGVSHVFHRIEHTDTSNWHA